LEVHSWDEGYCCIINTVFKIGAAKHNNFIVKIYVLLIFLTSFGHGNSHQANPLKIRKESKMIKERGLLLAKYCNTDICNKN
jgi:hypothetical protein